jgi:hypothetical protein
MYSLFWRSPALPYTQKQTAITVPAGAVVSSASSLRFTGKGATNYGKIQQENLLRLLENFAGPTAPDNPTVGQTWYDTAEGSLKVCISTTPVSPSPIWNQINSTQVTGVGLPPPLNPTIGDTWFSITGSASGILYVYTGVGRYPARDWNALAAGYLPAASGTSSIVLNSSGGAANTNYGEAYITGTILLNSVVTPLPASFVATNSAVLDGLIIWDQTGGLVGSGTPYHCVQKSNDGRWFYDDDTGVTEFIPQPNMFVIGHMTVAESDDQSPPGITSATMHAVARPLTNMVQAPATAVGGAIGGWEQIWPAVQTHAGRLEYEFVYQHLIALIGNPLIFGGSGAEGRSIQYLTDFRTLDASLSAAWQAATPLDLSVQNTGAIGDLRVDPNSQDWDRLLAACRYAVERLELPDGFSSDIATYPFVQDGLAPPPGVPTLPNSLRNTRVRIGTATILSQYQETVNVLRAALQNRFIARGLLESSGSGNAFAPGVFTANQASFNSSGSLAGPITHGLAYRFNYAQHDVRRFFFSAGVLEVKMTYSASAQPADIALSTLVSTMGRIRITADNTYVMTPSPSPTLAMAPTGLGYLNMTAPGIVLATLTAGGATIIVRGSLVTSVGLASPDQVVISLEITAGGFTSGSMNVLWSFIRDTETYVSGPVFPPPIAYQLSDKQGSASFT